MEECVAEVMETHALISQKAVEEEDVGVRVEGISEKEDVCPFSQKPPL